MKVKFMNITSIIHELYSTNYTLTPIRRAHHGVSQNDSSHSPIIQVRIIPPGSVIDPPSVLSLPFTKYDQANTQPTQKKHTHKSASHHKHQRTKKKTHTTVYSSPITHHYPLTLSLFPFSIARNHGGRRIHLRRDRDRGHDLRPHAADIPLPLPLRRPLLDWHRRPARRTRYCRMPEL